MKPTYNSSAAAKQAYSLGADIVCRFVQQGITNVSCKLDNVGNYGIFFKFDSDEVHALTIDNHRKSRFDPAPAPLISIRYRTVYRFGGGSRAICTGLTLGKTLPSAATIVNNLKTRHLKIGVAHAEYAQYKLEERVFKLENKGLQREFPRFKANIGGEPDEGSCVHSIHFDELSIGRARQILEILTKYLPEHYEVGEDS